MHSSKTRKLAPETKKRHSRKVEQDDDSDDDRVYVVRPESKESRKPQQTPSKSKEPSVSKAGAKSSQSNKATTDRKPLERRHTAPVPIVEVDEEQLK